jgi:hydrogenase maturation protease
VTAPRVLVAGIGNIFFGDDAFGVEVAQRLAGRPLPDGVKVVDFGIRGVHLAYELLDGYDALVLVDALPMGEPPGTVAVIEPELDGEDAADDTAHDTAHDTEPSAPLEAHSMSPAVVLAMVAGLGARVGRVLIVGCQPAVVDEGIGLSPVIGAAVDTGVATVIEVLDDLCVVAGKES